MAILRQYVFPFLIVVMFLVALLAVSARIFLPADMAAPAPTGEVSSQPKQAQAPGSVFLQLAGDGVMGNG